MFGIGSTKTDRSFYEAFERHARCIVGAAKKVAEAISAPTNAAAFAKEVRDYEQEGDQITHDTIARLHKTWITPLDRGDIHALIVALDDVLDLTEAVAERLALYDLTASPDFEPITTCCRSAVSIRIPGRVSSARHRAPRRSTATMVWASWWVLRQTNSPWKRRKRPVRAG